MNYDINFKVKVEGIDFWVEPYNCSANTTWNVREMIRKSTGLPWNNCKNNGLCIDIIPHIEKGVEELELHPEKYEQYEADNGWGTVDGTLNFFIQILREWEYFKMFYPELENIATFWIE